MSSGTRISIRLAFAVMTSLLLAAPAWAQAPGDTPGGDRMRGRVLYDDVYRCYACHGYDAQSSGKRLKPLRFTRQAFVAFVRSPLLPQMPAYSDAPAQDLADLYAYIVSIPEDASEPGELSLLQEILDRQRAAPAAP
jgi:mono/diheme cytochrome c family protein